jgi:hypothetical protein
LNSSAAVCLRRRLMVYMDFPANLHWYYYMSTIESVTVQSDSRESDSFCLCHTWCR